MTKLFLPRRCIALALAVPGTLSLPADGGKGRLEGSRSKIAPKEDDSSDPIHTIRALHRKRPKREKQNFPKSPKSPFKGGKWDTETLDFITPGVLFGTGNANGYFNTCRNPDTGVEVGLRARLRFDDNCAAMDCATNNSTCNADGTYQFDNEDACGNSTDGNDNCGWSNRSSRVGQFENALSCSMSPRWSFDWSINVAYQHNASGADPPQNVLSNFTYELGVDCDSGDKTKFDPFDPISLEPFLASAIPAVDHVFSTNNGNATDASTVFTVKDDIEPGINLTKDANSAVQQYYDAFKDLLDTKYVVQNSANVRFLQYPGTCLTSFDPTDHGHYVVYLCILDRDSGRDACCAAIQVLVGDATALKKFKISGRSKWSKS